MFTAHQIINECKNNKWIIPAINFENYDMLEGIIKGASMVERPIILQTTEPVIDFLGIDNICYITNRLLEKYGVRGYLHLDHGGGDVKKIIDCIDKGYKSIMIDYSQNTIDENVELTQNVVRMLKEKKILIEAEVGFVGDSERKSIKSELNDILYFCEKVDVDMLAISVGSRHAGKIESEKIDFGLLRKIKKEIDIPFVIHGGSGVITSDLRKTVEYGVVKVNYETKFRIAFCESLMKIFRENPEEYKVRKIMSEVQNQIAKYTCKIYSLLGHC